MSSKKDQQAEANKARRISARRERENKRAAAAATTKPAAAAPPKSPARAQSRPRRPAEPVVPVEDAIALGPEDRDGRLAIFLMLCIVALLALLIIAIVRSA